MKLNYPKTTYEKKKKNAITKITSGLLIVKIAYSK